MSPFWLGVERVTDVPEDTPTYDVHPINPYALEAEIGPSATDVGSFFASTSDGMYVPYVNSILPEEAHAAEQWICVRTDGAVCEAMNSYRPELWVGGADHEGEPFDVGYNVTAAQLNRLMHELARRADYLGAPEDPAAVPLAQGAIEDLARSKGFTDLVDALEVAGTDLEMRTYLRATPYSFIPDSAVPRLFLVVPEIVVEVFDRASPAGNVIARIVGDIIDPDFQLALSTGGEPGLDAAFSRDFDDRLLTVDFLPGCFASETSAFSCASDLESVVTSLVLPHLRGAIRSMFEQLPAPTWFDAGQESQLPRQLKSPRASADNRGVMLFADLCNPARRACDD